MAALGLALFTISSPATGHPVLPVPTAGFHDVFALTTGLARRGRAFGRSQCGQPK